VDILRAEDTIHLRNTTSPDTAQYLLQQGKVKAIVYIPSGFDSTLGNNKNVFLTVYLDNTDP